MDEPSVTQTDSCDVPIATEQVSEVDGLVRFLTRRIAHAFENPGALRTFFSLTGGSILYCLSGLSIIYGIASIMTGMLAKSNGFADALPCIAAISVYEIALFAVLITIVVWKNVTDDAISLVVLVGLFVVAGGVVLGTGAYHSPRISSYIGLICAGLGIVKLSLMKRILSFRIGSLSMIGLTWVLLWNYLMSSVMGGLFAASPGEYGAYREYWLMGWMVLLAGGILILVEAIRSAVISGLDEEGNGVFLQSRSMTWIFMMIVLVGMGVHQYGLAYMYRVSHAVGDYIPLVSIVSLLLLELMRSTAKRFGKCEFIAASIPLTVVAYAILTKSVTARWAFGVELLWYPPVILTLTGLSLLCISIHHRSLHKWLQLSWVGIAYGLAVLLTVGYSPDDPYKLNWQLFGAGIVVLLLAAGIFRTNPTLCYTAVMVLAAGAGCTDAFAEFARSHGLILGTAMAGLAGLGTMIICLAFGVRTPRVLTVVAGIGLTLFALDYLGAQPAWRDLAAIPVTAILCWALWRRMKDFTAIPIMAIPLICKLYAAARAMSSWGFVLLSFLLLLGGAAMSLFGKTTHAHTHPPEEI